MDEPRKVSSQIDDELKAVLSPSDKLDVWFRWLSQYSKLIAALVLIVLASSFGLWKMNQRQVLAVKNLNDWKATWLQTPTARSSIIDPMDQVLRSYPQWMGTWKGSFLQTALNLNRQDLINYWLDKPNARLIPSSSPLSAAHDQASFVSILLANGQWQEAINQIDKWLDSHGKDPQIKEMPSMGLCHLQLLAQKAWAFSKLEQPKAELQSWLALLQALGLDETTVYQAGAESTVKTLHLKWLQAHGHERISLLDYLREHLRHLKEKTNKN